MPARGFAPVLGVAAVVAAAVAWFAPSAGAATFGIPLGTAPFNVVPNNQNDCRTYTTFAGTFPVYSPTGPPNLATSCIWTDVPTPAEVAAFGGANISLEPPANGTVTKVRVGVGAITGPMEVVVMRSLYQNTTTPGHPNDACCFPVARSAPFTPQAGAITTVTVNLPVKEDPTPPPYDITTIADFDTITLAVLEDGVPVPMYCSATDFSAPADFLWNTSTPSTVTPGFYSDTGGCFVAMNGDWTAAPAGGGPGGGAIAAPIKLANNAANVRNGRARLALRCALTTACIGRLLLQNTQFPGAGPLAALDPFASAAKATVTYGSASFKIAANGTKTIVVRLNKKGKRLLSKHRNVSVWANVTFSSGGRSYAGQIKLHRKS